MKSLYLQKEFDVAKSTDLLLLECELCSQSFHRMKKDIKRSILGTRPEIKCCSISCARTYKSQSKKINCTNCNILFEKLPKEIKKSKFGNHFCSQSCAASYNNKNKKTGTTRSKLESWIEIQLYHIYPKLKIDFNKKNTIGSELDIYIPNLIFTFQL